MYWKIIGCLFNNTAEQDNCNRKNNLGDKKIA